VVKRDRSRRVSPVGREKDERTSYHVRGKSESNSISAIIEKKKGLEKE